jgi:hypothetical protein
MLNFALQYWLAIDDITRNKAAALHKYELDNDEWQIAKQLCDMLQVYFSFILPNVLLTSHQIFKDTTSFFSRSTPNLATVIPAMDHIDETLTSQATSRDFEPSIRAAIGLAKKTLNRYYSATDQSDVYHIAIGMQTPSPVMQ